MDANLLAQAQRDHDTFKPVSILDRGLELDEDDFNYDTNFNMRATMQQENYSEYRQTEFRGVGINNDSFARQSILNEVMMTQDS